jgi:hypothetical protein
MIKEVFNLADLPERRLQVKSTYSLQSPLSAEEAERLINERLAETLARKILEQAPFFSKRCYEIGGLVNIDIEADCIVLTTEEFAQMRKDSQIRFRKPPLFSRLL